ncbi:MAG: hypothetical protein NPINA01_24980 [Nitrospinaceae bacterium]|nr:MAG: hypothetical protein NPINA01_24980 [Nitrospinaceae bacterium]
MEPQKPSYDIDDFISECASEAPRVTVAYDAEMSAKNNFNLPTDKDLISFIGNGGLNPRKFKNSSPQRLELAGNRGKMVDAYHFRIGQKIGYIAFLFNEQQKKWRIKSFKNNTQQVSPKLRKMLGVK